MYASGKKECAVHVLARERIAKKIPTNSAVAACGNFKKGRISI